MNIKNMKKITAYLVYIVRHFIRTRESDCYRGADGRPSICLKQNKKQLISQNVWPYVKSWRETQDSDPGSLRSPR